MAASGPRPVSVTLTTSDRRGLQALVDDESASERLRDRARIVLAAERGLVRHGRPGAPDTGG